MKYYGHEKVALIDGGRVKWEKEGREYSTEVPSFSQTDYQFHGSPKEDIRAYRNHVESKLGKAGYPIAWYATGALAGLAFDLLDQTCL